MKFENHPHKLPTRLKWGLLPAQVSPEHYLLQTPLVVANDPQTLVSISYPPKRRLMKYYSPDLNDNYNEHANDLASILDVYAIFRESSFIKFFERSKIDVPKAFQLSLSLRRPTFELFFLRLANYLMRGGKKEKTFVAINKAMQLFFAIYKKEAAYIKTLKFSDWVRLYFAFNNVSFFKDNYSNIVFNIYRNTANYSFFKYHNKYYTFLSYLNALIVKYLLVVQPMFQFSLFSLGKRARKAKQKKKSKYVFIWKYVPVYRRKALLLKLVANDAKFIVGKNLASRLASSLDTLYRHPQQSHVWQTTNFAHNHVFTKLRRSLLANLKMTA